MTVHATLPRSMLDPHSCCKGASDSGSPVVDAVEEAETEEDAIEAVRRLWKELGLLWPEDVEETPVEDFDEDQLAPGHLPSHLPFRCFLLFFKT